MHYTHIYTLSVYNLSIYIYVIFVCAGSIISDFNAARVNPGEMAGVLAAQSIGAYVIPYILYYGVVILHTPLNTIESYHNICMIYMCILYCYAPI